MKLKSHYQCQGKQSLMYFCLEWFNEESQRGNITKISSTLVHTSLDLTNQAKQILSRVIRTKPEYSDQSLTIISSCTGHSCLHLLPSLVQQSMLGLAESHEWLLNNWPTSFVSFMLFWLNILYAEDQIAIKVWCVNEGATGLQGNSYEEGCC